MNGLNYNGSLYKVHANSQSQIPPEPIGNGGGYGSGPGPKTRGSGRNYGKWHAPLHGLGFFLKTEYNPNIYVGYIYPDDLLMFYFLL